MIINIALPWYKAHKTGRSFDVLHVDVEQSELDGPIVTSGHAVSLLDQSHRVPLPPYIAAKDVEAFLLAMLGHDHGASKKALVD